MQSGSILRAFSNIKHTHNTPPTDMPVNVITPTTGTGKQKVVQWGAAPAVDSKRFQEKPKSQISGIYLLRKGSYY